MDKINWFSPKHESITPSLEDEYLQAMLALIPMVLIEL